MHKKMNYPVDTIPRIIWNIAWKLNNVNTCYLGFLRTMITESPRRNILLINRSLLTGRAFFLPFPVLGTYPRIEKQLRHSALIKPTAFAILHDTRSRKTKYDTKNSEGKWYSETQTSVHISRTFSSTMLQWRSKARTWPKSFLLLRQLMST